ncbi:MAG: UDP-forming cellulose synthase catalytic subunit [Candidatus Acidiferrum sp.]
MLYLVSLPLDWRQQLFVSVCLVVVAVLVNRLSKSAAATIGLAALSILSSTRYIYYRVTSTFGFGMETGPQPSRVDMIFMLILLSAESYAYVIMILGYFQTVRPLKRTPVSLPANSDEWPTVDIFVPTYNEPLSVVRYTVWAAMNIDWPADKVHVCILDDGRREEFRKFAFEAGCGYMTRTNNAHAKAGNINHALGKTNGEFVAIFDCDHVPTRSFLQMTVGWFLKDSRLAMLQTPHHFYSPDPFERNLKQFRKIPNEGELFYGLIQDGNDLWNATFFCGSCAVLRRSALEEIGGIAVETVTEDAHTSLRMQIRGWNTAYINIPQAAGLATESLSSHVGQRIRWARGMVQILRVDNPLTRKKLGIAQRLCYFNAMVHFLYAIPRLIFLTSPLVFLLLRHKNIRGYSLTIMAYALSHIVLSSLSNSRIQGQFRHSFWNEVYEAVLAPYILMPTMMALLNPRLGKFNVTAKGGLVPKSFFDRKIAWPYIVLLLLNILGLVSSIPAFFYWGVAHTGTIAMNLIWTLYNIIILGTACAVAFESEQKREHVRVALQIPVEVHSQNAGDLRGETIDFSNGGLAVRIPKGLDIDEGESVKLSFTSNFVKEDIPATVVGYENGRLRFRFNPLSLHQEETLTKILYSRADSWLNWNEKRERDRPLRSLLLITRLSFHGVWLAISSLFKRAGNSATFENETAELTPTPSASRAALLVLLGFLLLGTHANAANSVASVSKDHPTGQSFRITKDFKSLGSTKQIVLRGLQGQHTLNFSIPSSQVATIGKLHLKYQLGAGLEAFISQLIVSVNGIKVASVRLVHTPPNSPAEANVDIPADFLLPENSVTLELAGMCLTRCAGQEFITTIERDSTLELAGQRLKLNSDLSQLPAPFLYPQMQNVTVCFSLPDNPGALTLEAAGIIASWLTVSTNSRSIRFPVVLGAIPQEDIVLVGPAQNLPSSLGLGEVKTPLIALRRHPADEYSTVLVVTGADEKQVRAAAEALAQGDFKKVGQNAEILDSAVASSSGPDRSKLWLDTRHPATFGDSFPEGQLVFTAFSAQTYFFKLPPDLYFGNRGGIPLQLNFRVQNLPSHLRPELSIALNGIPVANLHPAEDAEPIQHATVFLPVSALKPYSNQLRVEWKGDQAFASAGNPDLQIMRNSSIDLREIPHFVEMPQLERFSEAGYPFSLSGDLSHTAFVLANPRSPEQIGLYLELVSHIARQTGYPAMRFVVEPASAVDILVDRDLLVIGEFGDSVLAEKLGREFPFRFVNGAPAFAVSDNPWKRIRRSAWNIRGRTRQSIEDLLNSDPKPEAIIAGFESPTGHSQSGVAIFGNGPDGVDAIAEQLASSNREGAIYGSVSVLYDGRFESLYLTRNEYRIGSLPWSEWLTSWFLNHVFLVPMVIVVCCALPAWWILSWLEYRAYRRLVVLQ